MNGNYVNYTYDSIGRLTRIAANDGRQIDLTYSGQNAYISSISAHGRVWTYSYSDSDFSNPAHIDNYAPGRRLVLDSVARPDGTQWQFELDSMEARPGPGAGCFQNLQTLEVTHPDGTRGEFQLREEAHRIGYNALTFHADTCASETNGVISAAGLLAGIPAPAPEQTGYFQTMAVQYKKLFIEPSSETYELSLIHI